LLPGDSIPHYFYGRWLREMGRISDAKAALRKSAELNSADLDPRYLLMAIYAGESDWPALKAISDEVLRVAPNDAEGLRYRDIAAKGESAPPTPEQLLNASLARFKEGKYEDCIRIARQALELRPDYAEAHNNIAAGHQAMGHWDEAINAAKEALRIKPDFQLAKNNLAYSMSQKAKLAAVPAKSN
jgi:tetratricopeptide (TPR) repeat protein